MANLIAVMGASGFGKSTSLFPNLELNIKGLNPEETYIINVSGKPLPGKGSMNKYPLGKKISEGGNHRILTNPSDIATLIGTINNTPKFKNLIIDDAGYIMGFDVIDNAKKKGYDKWVDGAVSFMGVINAAKAARMDLNIVFTFHTEMGKDERMKIKTAGAMIDNNIYLDGLFTSILEADVRKVDSGIEFGFRTNGDGSSTCKTPPGMFDLPFIPNDMGYVLEKMQEYYYGETPSV